MFKWLLDVLSWNFNPSGVVSTTGAPSGQTVTTLYTLGKVVVEGKCTICSKKFWGWRQQDYCGTFKCFRELRRLHRNAGK